MGSDSRQERASCERECKPRAVRGWRGANGAWDRCRAGPILSQRKDQRKTSGGSSKYRGVSETTSLGYFADEIAAARAYDAFVIAKKLDKHVALLRSVLGQDEQEVAGADQSRAASTRPTSPKRSTHANRERHRRAAQLPERRRRRRGRRSGARSSCSEEAKECCEHDVDVAP